jgi:hypothetical protein
MQVKFRPCALKYIEPIGVYKNTELVFGVQIIQDSIAGVFYNYKKVDCDMKKAIT